LRDISLSVCRGEVVGIAGLQGHGQTELLNCIAGLAKSDGGRISINSREARIHSAKGAIRAGIAFVPEERKTQGLMLNLSIRKNISIVSLFLLQFMGFIRMKKEGGLVRETVRTLSIKASRVDQLVRELSGGNQQKVVLGKGLTSSPKVLLFNEPTRGIDVEAKHDFYQLMREYAQKGIAVIIYSSDLIELIGMSDRVVVLYEGRGTGVLEGEDLNEENIMRCAVGIGKG
jgi:ABC-type sugar transport system ATPase subunit